LQATRRVAPPSNRIVDEQAGFDGHVGRKLLDLDAPIRVEGFLPSLEGKEADPHGHGGVRFRVRSDFGPFGRQLDSKRRVLSVGRRKDHFETSARQKEHVLCVLEILVSALELNELKPVPSMLDREPTIISR
jgi:hypothetical protein